MDVALWIVSIITFLVGVSVGGFVVTWRFVRLERERRATLGAASGIARIGHEALPVRSVADILSGRVQVVLGGIPYVLPVLARRATREWLARVDERWALVGAGLEAAGDNVPEVLTLLAGHTDYMVEMLRAYDIEHILPDDEFIETYATDGEILAGMVEVWRAANPLAAIGAEAAAETMAGTGPAPLNSQPENTDGVLSISTPV